jgi:hypothetical protein
MKDLTREQALENALLEIRDRLNHAHAHDCVGWDCARCGGMAASQLQGLIDDVVDKGPSDFAASERDVVE